MKEVLYNKEELFRKTKPLDQSCISWLVHWWNGRVLCKTVGIDSQLQIMFNQMPWKYCKELYFTLGCCSLLAVALKTGSLCAIQNWTQEKWHSGDWKLHAETGLLKFSHWSLDLGMETFCFQQASKTAFWIWLLLLMRLEGSRSI